MRSLKIFLLLSLLSCLEKLTTTTKKTFLSTFVQSACMTTTGWHHFLKDKLHWEGQLKFVRKKKRRKNWFGKLIQNKTKTWTERQLNHNNSTLLWIFKIFFPGKGRNLLVFSILCISHPLLPSVRRLSGAYLSNNRDPHVIFIDT